MGSINFCDLQSRKTLIGLQIYIDRFVVPQIHCFANIGDAFARSTMSLYWFVMQCQDPVSSLTLL